MIVVVDSSVWISALQFGGIPLDALDQMTGRHQIAVCDAIVTEVNVALGEKFGWRKSEIEAALADFAEEILVVTVRGALRGVCRDANDDMVVECAVNAGAEMIVSGDKDLLSLKRYKSIRIVSARAFLRAIDTE